jgi:UDP-N-acetylglucosamine acyltransferase
VQDKAVTTIGNDNWIMAYCHSRARLRGGQHHLANNARWRATWSLGDWVTGRPHRITSSSSRAPMAWGFASAVSQESPSSGDGTPLAAGINVGLRRRGFSAERIAP